MSSVAGQSVAIGNLGKVGGNQVYAQMNQDKLKMFVERYLELSSELKYRKGESGAYMQLGELLTQQKDYDTGTKHFYRAMKIAEENEDTDLHEAAKVNYGMANASAKWNEHITSIIKSVDAAKDALDKQEDDDDLQERVGEEDDDQP